MSIENLTLKINYDIKNNKFKVEGEIDVEKGKELIEIFLRQQFNSGKDHRTPDERDVYHLDLKWFPEKDKIHVNSDTGNNGLRDGILMHYLSFLEKTIQK